jgi:hypothetical protein
MMANLDPQVQIKLIEISREWAQMAVPGDIREKGTRCKLYLDNFNAVYKQLVKTVTRE